MCWALIDKLLSKHNQASNSVIVKLNKKSIFIKYITQDGSFLDK